MSAVTRSIFDQLRQGMAARDAALLEGIMCRADTSFLKNEAQIKSAFTSLAKTLTFLDFYSDKPLKVRNDKGALRPTVDAFCDVMADKMTE